MVTVRRPMVVVSFADFGQNNHREDVPDFTSRLKTEQFSPVYEPLHLQGSQVVIYVFMKLMVFECKEIFLSK